ncbi:MAG: BspA family leucine-rich repeat surface protein, partial [bacterium]
MEDNSIYTQRQIAKLGSVKNRPKEMYPNENPDNKDLSIIFKAKNYNDRKFLIGEEKYIDNRPFGYYITKVDYKDTISFDMNEAASNEILLKGDLFIDDIQNINNGSEYIFIFKQDETGDHSVTVNSDNVNLFIANNKSLEDIDKNSEAISILKVTCVNNDLLGELSTSIETLSGYTEVNNNSFSFDIEIANSGDTFTLPIDTVDDADEYEQNFTADWGVDSSTDITSHDNAGATHTYDQPGTYTITMTGKSELFAVEDSGDKSKIVKLNNFFGDIGFKKLNFHGCNNLEGNIPTSFKNLRKLIFVNNLFRSCSSLEGEIPEDMFWNSPNITNMYGLFWGVGLTGEIPEKLFWNNPKLKDVGALFFSTNFTGTIPEKLFWNNPKIKDFYYTFSQSNISGQIPEKLFWYNPEVTGFQNMFWKTTTLTGSIPEKLFWYNPKVTTFQYTFYRCENLTGSIPEKLFWNNPEVVSFQHMFYKCTGLTGNIPEK